MEKTVQERETLVAFKGTDAQIKFAEKVRANALQGIDQRLAEFTEDIAFESDPVKKMEAVDPAVVALLEARRAYWTEVRNVIARRLSGASWLLDHRGGIYPALIDLPYFVDTVAKLAKIARP